MEIPRDIMNKITAICNEENYGLLELRGEKFAAIIIGSKDYSPDQASIIVAHALLHGVISGDMNQMNDAALAEEKIQ